MRMNGLKAAWVMLAAIAWMTTAGGCMSAEDAAAFRDELASTLTQVESAQDEARVLITQVREQIQNTDDDEVLAGLTDFLADLEAQAGELDGQAELLSARIAEIEDGPADAIFLDIGAAVGMMLGIPGLGGLAALSEYRRRQWKQRMGTVVASVDHVVQAASEADRKAIAKKQGETLTTIVKDMAAEAA